jgi:hypothetical protein
MSSGSRPWIRRQQLRAGSGETLQIGVWRNACLLAGLSNVFFQVSYRSREDVGERGAVRIRQRAF